MSKLDNVYALISTMSKAERRQFKLFTNIQKGDKGYTYLYDKLASCNNPEEACSAFSKKHGKKNIAVAVRYLHEQLTECLIHLKKENNAQDSIFKYITQANFFYKRFFINEAFDALRKAKQLAKKHEQDILLMLIRRVEIKYITEIGFGELTEKEFVKKQTKLIETQKYIRSTNMHMSLYSTLTYRLRNFDKIRSGKQKELLNDLVLSELNLVSNNYYQGFEAKKLHLLFQAAYYLNTGSYKSAIRYYTELLNLFDKYEHLKQDPPIYYYSTLEGVINSLFNTGIYNEIPTFIEKLEELKKRDYPKSFLLEVESLIIFSQTQYFVHKGKFLAAKQFCSTYDSIFLKKSEALLPEYRLRLLLSFVVVYLHNGEIKEANKYMKKIIRESKLFQLFPAYRTSRLLKLLIDAELSNFDLLDNDIRSIKRSIKKGQQICQIEKIVCTFVQMYPIPKHEKTRSQLWKKLMRDIMIIREDKYERQVLNIFDFTNWIESKLT